MAENYLFKVDDACTKLCEINKILSHRLVENLLFLSKCARPHILLTIELIAMRVQNPDDDDCKEI